MSTQSDHAINVVLSSYKRLNPNKTKVLIACSAGADSMALVFCLSLIRDEYPFVVGHITHDIRPPEQTQKDFDCVRGYCEKLGLEFRHAKVYPIEQKSDDYKNLEHAASVLRYESLEDLRLALAPGEKYTTGQDCSGIVTGHHADDQLETILMKIGRGTGLRGLSGIARRKEVGNAVYLRPMLDITKDDCYAICKDKGIPWVEDSTNSDEKITRNFLRKHVIPGLRDIFPNIAQHATDACDTCDSAQKVVEDKACELWKFQNRMGMLSDNAPIEIRIEALQVLEDIVIYEWLFGNIRHRIHHINLLHIHKEEVDKIIRAIRARQRKKFWITDDLLVQVLSDKVSIRRTTKEEKKAKNKRREHVDQNV